MNRLKVLDYILQADISEIAVPFDLMEYRSSPMESTGEMASQSFEEVEKQLVVEALARAEGNQSKAARRLKIGRDALRYKMKKYGLLWYDPTERRRREA